jgi:hypothetical protein
MSDAPAETPLSLGAFGRLRNAAEGNNLKTDDILFLGTEEMELTVKARMRFIPEVEKERINYPGPLRALKNIAPDKTHKVGQESDIEARAQKIKTDMEEQRGWLSEAVTHLKKQPGEGWGLHEAAIVMDERAEVFYVQTNCQNCRGIGKAPCMTCQGAAQVSCTYCRAIGQEICPGCNGTGANPSAQGQYCPMCNGSTMIICRQCHGTKRLTCTACQGQGNLTCQTCGGHGVFTVEETVTPSLRTDFQILESGSLPSGFRRAIAKGGPATLTKGHATITSEAADEKDPKNIFIPYKAVLPYAEMRLKIKGKPFRATVLGHKGILLDVPPFIEQALDPLIKQFEQEADKSATLTKALSYRAIKQAFDLMQEGNDNAQSLRRLYPAGMSREGAERIVRLVKNLTDRQTVNVRLAAGIATLVLIGIVEAFIIHSGARAMLAQLLPIAAFILDIGLCGSGYFLQDFVLRRSATWALRRKLKNVEAGKNAVLKSGKIGLILGLLTVILYVGMLFGLQAEPSWRAIFTHPFG